jgi:hypothetical protein
MVLGIFVGGIFLGFSLGLATMAVVAARSLRMQSAKAPEVADYASCAYPSIRKLSPGPRLRLRGSGIMLTPRP